MKIMIFFYLLFFIQGLLIPETETSYESSSYSRDYEIYDSESLLPTESPFTEAFPSTVTLPGTPMTTTWPYRGFGGWTEEPKLFFKRGIEGRIANGWGTKPGDYPFMARMSENCRFGQRCAFCGGSLITDEYVITAAHCCVEGKRRWRLKNSTQLEIGFALGAYYDETCSHSKRGNACSSLKVPSFGKTFSGKFFKAKKLILHPNFAGGPRKPKYDYCLAKIEKVSKADFDQKIQIDGILKPMIKTIDLAEVKPLEKTICKIVGWGKIGHKAVKYQSSTLLSGEVKIIQDKKCDNNLSRLTRIRLINKELICAVGLRTGKKKNLFMDTCQGDSGGPILCKDGGEFKLSGIVSGGMGNCGTGKKSFYSAISIAAEWISNVTGIAYTPTTTTSTTTTIKTTMKTSIGTRTTCSGPVAVVKPTVAKSTTSVTTTTKITTNTTVTTRTIASTTVTTTKTTTATTTMSLTTTLGTTRSHACGNKPVIKSGPGIGKCCHFPFIFNGRSYYKCIPHQTNRRLWCSAVKDFHANIGLDIWGYC